MITPKMLKGVHKRLPFLKLKFTEFDDPDFPHLSEQLEFLADVVEDFVKGWRRICPIAVVDAAFALIYADRQVDLLPEAFPGGGLAEDAAVVRFVLLEHEKVFAAYAARHEMRWEEVAVSLRNSEF